MKPLDETVLDSELPEEIAVYCEFYKGRFGEGVKEKDYGQGSTLKLILCMTNKVMK
jgi:hypothetical protein